MFAAFKRCFLRDKGDEDGEYEINLVGRVGVEGELDMTESAKRNEVTHVFGRAES